VATEPQANENGERLIWIEERRLNKLNSIRRSGERLGGDHPAGDAGGRILDAQTTLSKLKRPVSERRELYRRYPAVGRMTKL
jgi:hypothetical protein